MFLIPVSDNILAENCTDTLYTRIASIIGYPYSVVFDRDTLFMSDYFKDWQQERESGWNCLPYTTLRTDGQSEIDNEAIHQATRVCKVEGNKWLHNLSKI